MNPMDPNQPYQPQPQPAPQPAPAPIPQPPAAPQPFPAAPTPAPAPPAEPQPFAPHPGMQPEQPAPPPSPAPAPNPFAAPAQPVSPFAPNPQPQPMAQMPPQQPQPVMPMAHHGTSSKPPIMIIAIIIAAVLLIGGGIASYFLFFQSGSGPSGILSNIGGTPDVMDRPDGTLDLSKLIDTDKTIRDQTIKAKINQQVSLSDGLTYMVTGVERNYTSSSRYFKPNAGKEFVRVSFVVGNRDKKTPLYLGGSQFKAKNSAGGLRAAEYATDEDVVDAMVAQEIDGGKQIKGSYVFQVDKGETFSIVTNQEYIKLGSSGQKATVASEISL